jgi:hypothetical protein
MRAEIWDGEVVVTRNLQHVYRVSDQNPTKKFPAFCPNVTKIVGMKDKSNGLMRWQMNMAIEAFHKKFPVGNTYKWNEKQMEKVEYTLRNAAAIMRDGAAAIGSMVHDYAERRLLGEKVDMPMEPSAKIACQAFEDWQRTTRIDAQFLERTLYSREHHIVGTADFIGLIGNKMTVADFKTGKNIYSEVFMQLECYRRMYEEEFGITVDQRAVIHFDKVTGAFEFVVLNEDTRDRDWETFLALKQVYQFDKDSYKELKQLREAA